MEQAGQQQIMFGMLKTSNYVAFQLATNKGYVKIIELLLERLKQVQEEPRAIKTMLTCYGYAIFYSAVEDGHVQIVELLLKQAEQQQIMLEMLQANDYAAFRSAAKHNHLTVCESLWKRAEDMSMDEQSAMFNAGFVATPTDKRLALVQHLWNHSNNEQKLAIVTASNSPHRDKNIYSDKIVEWVKEQRIESGSTLEEETQVRGRNSIEDVSLLRDTPSLQRNRFFNFSWFRHRSASAQPSSSERHSSEQHSSCWTGLLRIFRGGRG